MRFGKNEWNSIAKVLFEVYELNIILLYHRLSSELPNSEKSNKNQNKLTDYCIDCSGFKIMIRKQNCYFSAFDDDNVTHVEGEVNPIRDLDIIQRELIKKDLQYLEGAIDKMEKIVVRGGDKSRKLEYETLLKVIPIEEGKYLEI